MGGGVVLVDGVGVVMAVTMVVAALPFPSLFLAFLSSTATFSPITTTAPNVSPWAG